MKLRIEITNGRVQRLHVWESSVRAMHRFLSDAEREKIREYVPRAIRGTEHLILAETNFGEPIAFMRTENGRLEMLFVSPEERGKGIGEQLLRYGMRNYAIREVAVGMNRIRRLSAFMSTWDSRHISERNAMSRAIRIRFGV